MISNCKRLGHNGMFCKLDFEKAFDKINCNFLFAVFWERGLSRVLIGWVHSLLSLALVAVLINGTLRT